MKCERNGCGRNVIDVRVDGKTVRVNAVEKTGIALVKDPYGDVVGGTVVFMHEHHDATCLGLARNVGPDETIEYVCRECDAISEGEPAFSFVVTDDDHVEHTFDFCPSCKEKGEKRKAALDRSSRVSADLRCSDCQIPIHEDDAVPVDISPKQDGSLSVIYCESCALKNANEKGGGDAGDQQGDHNGEPSPRSEAEAHGGERSAVRSSISGDDQA